MASNSALEYLNTVLNNEAAYNNTKAEINATGTKNTAKATADYEDELGDIDVWAAETAANDAKAASEKSYSALTNSGRSVGGGTFNSLVSGRGRISLGGLSGGLSAANAAKLADTKKADASGDLAAQTKYNAAVTLADSQTASTKNQSSNQIAANNYATTAATEQGEQIGSAYGINYFRRVDPMTGQIQYGTQSGGGSVVWSYSK
jgi:hypothetical protein